MPTHGYGPFRRFILGSNTAKVLHDADCPVWTGVHMEEAPPAASIPLRSVLCALDLGPQSPKALCWAAWLAKEFQARLTVLHVTNAVPDVDGSTSGVREAAREELRRLQETSNVEADLLVLSGEPAQAICTAAGGGGGRCAGDRPRVGCRRVRPAPHQRLRHHPAVAVPGCECVRYAC